MKTKRIIAFLLAALCLSFAACSNNDKGDAADTTATGTSEVKAETETISGMVDKVKEYYAEGTNFVYKADDDKEENMDFMFTYFFEDEKYLAAVEDYVLTVGDGVDTFAVIRFKEGTDKSMIDEAKGILGDVYAEGLKTTYAPYDPDAAKAAGEYEIKTDGNTVILVISMENKDDIKKAIGW